MTTAAGWTRLWPYRELRQTQGFYEGEEVRLERGGELAEAVVVSDAAFLQSLHEAAPHVGARFHDPAGAAARGAAHRRWRASRSSASPPRSISGAFRSLAALVAPRVPGGLGGDPGAGRD